MLSPTAETNVEPIDTRAEARLAGTVEVVKVGKLSYQIAYEGAADLACKIAILEASDDPVHRALASRLELQLPNRSRTSTAFLLSKLGADADLIARAVGVPDHVLRDGTFTTSRGTQA